MTNLEALQTRLKTFQAAGQNLQLNPLITPEDQARLGVAYQTELIDELQQAIEDSKAPNNKLIFTGHTGCGKSTLLAELAVRLTEAEQHFVVMFSIADTIERSAVDHVNILFSMALQLLEEAEKQKIKLPIGIRREFYQWLGKHTQTESQALESELEINAEASTKGGISLIFELIAKIKSKLKINAVIRQEISIEFGRKISELVEKIDQLKSHIENASNKQVLVVIDDLDKLDLSVTETIFSKNIQSLLDPNLAILYTIPIATLREITIKNTINGYFNKIYTMRVTKFFSKADIRKPERIADNECVKIFSQIIDRRLSPDAIDPEIKQKIILLSGGVLRELIRIVDRCSGKAMLALRRQIRNQHWDMPEVKIDRQILDNVVTDLRIERAEVLGRIDFDLLLSIYQKLEPEDTENQRFLDLLHGLYILEYRNAELWYDLNPIVIDLLAQKQMI